MLRLLLLVSLRGAVAFAPSPRVFGAGPRVAALRDAGTVVEDLTNENAVLRNELVRKDAIIEGLLQTLSASAMNTQVNAVVHATPLTDLCLRQPPHTLRRRGRSRLKCSKCGCSRSSM